MKKILILFLILFNSGLNSQTASSADTVSSKFRLDICFPQGSIGACQINLNDNLTDQSKYLMSTNNRLFGGWNFDVQAIFKDKIGFETGLDFLSGSINEKKIRKDFQSQVPDYKTSVLENDEPNSFPFEETYSHRLVKAGILGYFPVKKSVLLPYGDFLYKLYDAGYPKVTVKYEDVITGNAFIREFKYINTNTIGFKCGLGWRYNYFGDETKKRRHHNLYAQLKAEFIYLQTKGYAYYTDKDPNGSELKVNSGNFKQDFYSVVLTITLLGLDFHW